MSRKRKCTAVQIFPDKVEAYKELKRRVVVHLGQAAVDDAEQRLKEQAAAGSSSAAAAARAARVHHLQVRRGARAVACVTHPRPFRPYATCAT